MSQLMYQYAARYGHQVVDEDKLLVNAGQVKKSGMGVLSYYEDWNEQDRDWESRDSEFYPNEYAAMASANVDGHGGTLGEGYGLKTADPTAKFVMGGIYKMGTPYITAMLQWFKENRPDGQWPIDVINMHHYAYTIEKNGICPEEDGYKAKIEEIADWRDTYAPDNEIWITEFGYDTNSESTNRINPFSTFSQQEIQAQWIVRTYLIMSSAGVDRSAQFMLRDVEDNPEPRWRNCGLTLSSSEGYAPKTSWYYVYSLKNILEEMYFDRVISENNSAYVYRFKNRVGDKYIYALWSPTGNGSTSDFSLQVPENPNVLKKIELIDGSKEGAVTLLESISDLSSLQVTETPQFIIADYNPSAPVSSLPEQAGLQLFPNPFKGELQMRINDGGANRKVCITIYSSDGKEIQKCSYENMNPGDSMDLSKLESGVYFLVAKKGQQVYHEKIIKH